MANLRTWKYRLKLAHRWTIASTLGPGGGGGMDSCETIFVEVREADGLAGIGEAAPSSRYGESIDSAFSFLERVDGGRLDSADFAGSMRYLEGLEPGQYAAKGALNIAMLDLAARRAGHPLYDFLGLGFTEGKHVTSFSIGLDKPEVIGEKVRAAKDLPVLKLKVGGEHDRENLAALRSAAPGKRVRVDANEGWKTKEEALKNLEWLAEDGAIEFVEQPMPADTDPKDLLWLKTRSPLPLFADEAYPCAEAIAVCAELYHGVNVKLVKTGGITRAHEALCAARHAGLETMLGCMMESSVLISAAAHLAELADHLDLDSNLLITNDPFRGAVAEQGILTFRKAPEPCGLRAGAREPSIAG